MGIPENYVFRVQRTETFKYPCVSDMFPLNSKEKNMTLFSLLLTSNNLFALHFIHIPLEINTDKCLSDKIKHQINPDLY